MNSNTGNRACEGMVLELRRFRVLTGFPGAHLQLKAVPRRAMVANRNAERTSIRPKMAAPDFFSEPSWFLFRLDIPRRLAIFIPLDRPRMSDATFLDEASTGFSSVQPLEAPIRELEAAMARSPGGEPVGRFLFHTSFCCSTLIARCLDRAGTCLALKEPEALLNLASFKRSLARRPDRAAEFDSCFRLGLRLLNKPFSPGERVLVKPTNAANGVCDDLYRLHPDSRSVFLYSDLENFLISILKKGEAGRNFIRNIFTIVSQDFDPKDLPGLNKLFQWTDLQIAGLVWLIQLKNYLKVLRQFPGRPIRTLDYRRFLESPGEALRALMAFYGLPGDEEHVQAVLAGPLLKADAKAAGRSLDPGQRLLDAGGVKEQFKADIDVVKAWMAPLIREEGIPEILPDARLQRAVLFNPDAADLVD